MFRRIVIAIQEPGERLALVGTAARLASAGDSTVLALHIRKLGDHIPALAGDEELVEGAVSEARRLGLHAESEILEIAADREVGRAIAEAARGWQADLVVAGSRRLSDVQAVLRGSVSQTLTHFAGCPVMIAPRREAAPKIGSILLAVDSSRPARAAEQLVAEIAGEHRAKVSVLHVPEPLAVAGPVFSGFYVPPLNEDEVGAETADHLRTSGLTVDLVDKVPGGPVASVIAFAAEQVDADLIVLGSRGLAGVTGLLRGSVSWQVLHESERAMLVTRSAG